MRTNSDFVGFDQSSRGEFIFVHFMFDNWSKRETALADSLFSIKSDWIHLWFQTNKFFDSFSSHFIFEQQVTISLLSS